MSASFKALADLDKLVHEPARLALLTALRACERADFLYLQRLTGLTKGNLSSHLAKLEASGYVRIIKRFEQKKPVTYVELTLEGEQAVDAHWDHLAALRDGARDWSPEARDEG